MQSGISASTDLHNAFNSLVSSPTQRAVLATISHEQILPTETLPAQASNFEDDLHTLTPHLTPTTALYILLKLHPTEPAGYAAITYIPSTAPVRQKMLFASTRLTLVRELGLERFSQQIFSTEASELTKEGWARHEAHTKLEAPLTEEESGLRGVKDAEAAESRGTGGRRGHVSGRVDVKTGEGVVEALGLLREEGCKGTLVQLRFAVPGEVLTLESSTDGVQPEDVASTITGNEPRYSLYSLPSTISSSGEPEILFIYTCPSSSKIKERMIYSTGKSWTRTVAERDAGIVISRSLEATEPSELTVDVLGGEQSAAANSADASTGESGKSTPAASSGFARPKRPGRR